MIRLVLSLALLPLVAGADPKPPNIVLFVSDDMGYGDVSYAGESAVKTSVSALDARWRWKVYACA